MACSMTDQEFVCRCVRKDRQAWDEFVNKYSRLIYKYISAVLEIKGQNLSFSDNLNDIFQEIFLLLTKDNFKKLKSFKGKNGCTLATWLRVVTINFTIDYLRKLKPALSIDTEDEDGLALKDLLADDPPPITQAVDYQEKLKHLKDCIKYLDSDEKYFLELHLNQELTLEELKAHFRVSRGAIDMRKARITEKLRECFKGKGWLLDF